jgi:hypothetical protein
MDSDRAMDSDNAACARPSNSDGARTPSPESPPHPTSSTLLPQVPVLHQCPRPCVEASTPSTIPLDGGAPDGSNGGLAARNPPPLSPPLAGSARATRGPGAAGRGRRGGFSIGLRRPAGGRRPGARDLWLWADPAAAVAASFRCFVSHSPGAVAAGRVVPALQGSPWRGGADRWPRAARPLGSRCYPSPGRTRRRRARGAARL